jgi:hypothetical protein
MADFSICPICYPSPLFPENITIQTDVRIKPDYQKGV